MGSGLKLTRHFSAFRADIEGLRAIAVALVVIFHADLGGVHGGFIGVDIFFAISGYLITGLILAEFEAKGRLDFLGFYARRGRRLIPAVTVMIAVVLTIGFFLYSPDEMFEVAKSGASSSLYMSNMYFALQTKGYFSTHMAENPFLHTWSLSVEEQFYLFWPVFIFLCVKFTKSRLALLGVLGGITLVSFLIGLWLLEYNLNWGFYALPGRIWEFGLGGFARVLVSNGARVPRPGRFLIGWTGAGLVAASAFYLTEWVRFPGWPAVAPVLGTIMILAVGGQSSVLDKILGAPIMQWVGRRSYAIYLWHWPFLLLPVVWLGEPTLWHKLAYLAGTVLVAHISYHLIENPVRRHPWLVKRRFASIALTGGFAVIAGAIAVTTYVGARFEDRNPEYQTYREVRYAFPPELDARPECLVWPPSVAEVEMCSFSPANPHGEIILAGDSHAKHWFAPVLGAAEGASYSLTTVMKAGCAFSDVDVYNALQRRENPECKQWREEAIQEIIDRTPSLVIISTAAGAHVAGTAAWGDSAIGTNRQGWVEGLKRALTPMTQAGIPVLLIQHTPKLSTHGPTCLARTVRFDRSAEVCARKRDRALDQGILDMERAMLADIPGITLVDFSEMFCDDEMCYAKRDGMSIYMDVHHISDMWARSLQPQMETAILTAIAAREKAQ